MIETELERIDSLPWLDLIQRIVGNFQGVEFCEAGLIPAEEITYILRKISSSDTQGMKEKLLVQNMSKLEAFRFRAMKLVDGSVVTWNPLQQSYNDFVDGAKNLRIYQGESQFPTEDVIRASFANMLHQPTTVH